MKRPCIFFDRDGIVNESPGPGYVESWEDFYLQPGFVAALRVATSKGYPAVVITNQQGVAKGLYSEEELQDIHQRFRALLKAHRLNVLDIFYCPHFAVDNCNCRKPKPGMLIQASKKHKLDLSRSWVVGDSEKDVEAGHNAGCRAVFVGATAAKTAAEHRVDSVDELPELLEAVLEPCEQQ
jgi:D-glycero-D-manno-heptose 1,7-bisphosphate phosphatase